MKKKQAQNAQVGLRTGDLKRGAHKVQKILESITRNFGTLLEKYRNLKKVEKFFKT